MTSLVRGPVPAATLAATLIVAGCGGSSHRTQATTTPAAKPRAAAPKGPSDEEALDFLMADRGRALQVGDPAAMTKTSTGARQARDRREARAAEGLPLFDVHKSVRSADITGRRATLRVVTTYEFDDISTEFETHETVNAIRTPRGWRVESVRNTSVRAPWELGRYTVRRSPHFLALAPRGLRVDGLMTDLEAARALMRRGLPGVRPPARMVVVITRGAADTRALTKDSPHLDSVDAMAEARVRRGGPARRVRSLSGQRIVVLWRAFRRFAHADRRRVLAHELAHSALARRTTGRTPIWLVEGIAMYASGDDRSGDAGMLLSGAQLRDQSKQGAARRTLSLVALGRPGSMNRLADVPLAFAYSYASAAAYAIAQDHGRRALVRLYKAFDDERIPGRAGRKLQDRVVRRTLHQSLGSLQRSVDAYARAHAG